MATESELARLRAEAAEAEALAAQAAADAAAAKARAALAALAAAESSAGKAAVENVPQSESPASEMSPAALTPEQQAVAAGYQFESPTLPLGALIGPDGPDSRVQISLPLRSLNRHGLVAGATGTGKTRTLQLLAEGLSSAGVPVFITDIKGDLTGIAEPGVGGEKLHARTQALGQDWTPAAFPLELLSLGGRGNGTPVRTTITDFGPLLLAKVLGLNQTQESSLALIFRWADAEQLALIDVKDLRAVVQYLTSDEGKDELKQIGGVSSATAGVILRELAALQAQGAEQFFGEPAFDTSALLRTAPDGRGVISSLEIPDVAGQPALFSTFIMWLLADLFHSLPEVGDPGTPTLVFFFDEAHLLFTGASKEFLTQVVQTVRLIRSKGVGVFFVTQTPKDVPEDVLAQLGNRVQHALRAHTPADQDKLRQTVRTYPTSSYNLEEVLTTLGTGEAVVTVLAENGSPTPVAPTRLRAPQANMGMAARPTIAAIVDSSPLHARYAEHVDHESAFELLRNRMEEEARAAEESRRQSEEAEALAKQMEADAKAAEKARERELREAERRRDREERAAESERQRQSRRRERQMDNILSQVGREITRSIFGTRRR